MKKNMFYTFRAVLPYNRPLTLSQSTHLLFALVYFSSFLSHSFWLFLFFCVFFVISFVVDNITWKRCHTVCARLFQNVDHDSLEDDISDTHSILLIIIIVRANIALIFLLFLFDFECNIDLKSIVYRHILFFIRSTSEPHLVTSLSFRFQHTHMCSYYVLYVHSSMLFVAIISTLTKLVK